MGYFNAHYTCDLDLPSFTIGYVFTVLLGTSISRKHTLQIEMMFPTIEGAYMD